MTFRWLEESRNGSHVEEIDEQMSILENQHHFLTMCILDALNVNANRTKRLLSSTEKCSNHEFSSAATEKLPGWEKPHAKTVA